jgi:uncharacterized repeat protein (TIGR01451 family)
MMSSMKMKSKTGRKRGLKMKLKILLLPVIIILILASCISTTTIWVPVYSISYPGASENTSFDPRINAVINPEIGTVVAYYETDTKKSTVYGNEYSLSLAEKIVMTNDVIDKKESTKNPVTNLELYKSFYFDYYRIMKEPRDLYFIRNGSLIALNQSVIEDDQIVEYMLSGKNTGTEGITRIIIADILPRGFEYKGSGYKFSDNKGSFKHKVVTKNQRSSIIFESHLDKPLEPTGTFWLKIQLIASFSTMDKEFDY